MSTLLEPITLRGLTAPNRIWLAPMCQYSCLARDGVPTDWHLAHLGARALGGFGLIVTEAAAVVPEGRISPEDAGLWTTEQAAGWRRITDFAHGQGSAIAVQLAHAGRKASTYSPLTGRTGTLPESEGGWTTVAPSAIPADGLATPRAVTLEEIADVPRQFAASARLADEAGFDAIEVHAAHGYLLHEFLSPLSNDRDDSYGGSFENRTRLTIEVVDAIRDVWPDDKPLFVRFSGTDWLDGGWTSADTTRLAAILVDHGVDLIDVSSGGLLPASIEVGPGYQVPMAREVREGSGLATGAVGLITDPEQAEEIVATGDADVVLLARAALRDPSWPQRAAHELGEEIAVPVQYERGSWANAREKVR